MATKSSKFVAEIPVDARRSVRAVRGLFLWGISAVYFFAFASLYFQIPGLYGDNGILPARLVLKPESNKTLGEHFVMKPTLVWFAPIIGLDVQHTVELVALAGSILALVSLLVQRLREFPIYALLWVLYMSLYQIGQTFTWFQWDALLLEAGFLALCVAPLRILRWTFGGESGPHSAITLWLVRWLLFRLMFASGVVKLTSMCPTWWQLTALNYHFESQCIPTPLSWYVHHFPDWVLKGGVIGTYVIEIAVPFLFFAPVRSLRLFAFYAQVLLQVAIILTGNYNFFNMLTITLCVSLLDDGHLTPSVPVRRRPSSKVDIARGVVYRILEFGTYSALVYWTVTAFTLRFNSDWTVQSKIAFTTQEFHRAVNILVQVSICIAIFSLFVVVITALYRSLTGANSLLRKLVSFVVCLFYTSVAFWIFCISMIPHTVVDPNLNAAVWPVIRRWHDKVEFYQLVNSYGLFRRMTGVGGRPEVVIEGSDSLNGPWKEFHFVYKPGHLSQAPPIVAPHQPRLDWQMWFAALDSYQRQPWFVNLIHRILSGQSEVFELMDQTRNPFPTQAPKFVRAVQYLYSYTSPNKTMSSQDWWTRKKVGEYLPPLSKDHPSLIEYLQRNSLLEEKPKRKEDRITNANLLNILHIAREWTRRIQPQVFIWTAFVPALFIALLI